MFWQNFLLMDIKLLPFTSWDGKLNTGEKNSGISILWIGVCQILFIQKVDFTRGYQALVMTLVMTVVCGRNNKQSTFCLQRIHLTVGLKHGTELQPTSEIVTPRKMNRTMETQSHLKMYTLLSRYIYITWCFFHCHLSFVGGYMLDI